MYATKGKAERGFDKKVSKFSKQAKLKTYGRERKRSVSIQQGVFFSEEYPQRRKERRRARCSTRQATKKDRRKRREGGYTERKKERTPPYTEIFFDTYCKTASETWIG